jgi:glycosyltransferase involved in cell wall biosynthesis
LLVANNRTRNALPLNLKRKCVLEFVENGVDLDVFRPHAESDQHQEFHIVYLGRLVDWKRVDLLIVACTKLIGSLDFRLHIVGDGPLRGALEKQVQRPSLMANVEFHGRLPQCEAAELLRSADVMVLPSMRECGGAVVLEAMASAVPVIAANWGGPADYIAADAGIVISPATPDIFATKLADAMLALAKDPQLRAAMGKAGRQRAESLYDWRVKAVALLKIYEEVLSVHNSRIRAAAK